MGSKSGPNMLLEGHPQRHGWRRPLRLEQRFVVVPKQRLNRLGTYKKLKMTDIGVKLFDQCPLVRKR